MEDESFEELSELIDEWTQAQAQYHVANGRALRSLSKQMEELRDLILNLSSNPSPNSTPIEPAEVREASTVIPRINETDQASRESPRSDPVMESNSSQYSVMPAQSHIIEVSNTPTAKLLDLAGSGDADYGLINEMLQSVVVLKQEEDRDKLVAIDEFDDETKVVDLVAHQVFDKMSNPQTYLKTEYNDMNFDPGGYLLPPVDIFWFSSVVDEFPLGISVYASGVCPHSLLELASDLGIIYQLVLCTTVGCFQYVSKGVTSSASFLNHYVVGLITIHTLTCIESAKGIISTTLIVGVGFSYYIYYVLVTLSMVLNGFIWLRGRLTWIIFNPSGHLQSGIFDLKEKSAQLTTTSGIAFMHEMEIMHEGCCLLLVCFVLDIDGMIFKVQGHCLSTKFEDIGFYKELSYGLQQQILVDKSIVLFEEKTLQVKKTMTEVCGSSKDMVMFVFDPGGVYFEHMILWRETVWKFNDHFHTILEAKDLSKREVLMQEIKGSLLFLHMLCLFSLFWYFYSSEPGLLRFDSKTGLFRAVCVM